MKIFLYTIALMTLMINAQAQDINTVNIGVVCPDQMEGLSNSNLMQLRNKIEQIVSYNGVSTFMDGSFVIYPVFEIYDKKNIEGGMRKMVAVEVGLTLYIKQISTGMVANSTSLIIKGSGFSEPEAIINAIRTISPNNKLFNSFITLGKSRILQYYEENCEKILEKAKSLASIQKYEEALSTLAIYPTSLSSFSKVSEVIESIYKQYQSARCEKMLQEAKGLIAIHEYRNAIAKLSEIDPESSCRTECLTLLNGIKQKVDANEARELEMELKVFNANFDLEKRRIAAIRDIAKAYYENKTTVYYTQIVK